MLKSFVVVLVAFAGAPIDATGLRVGSTVNEVRLVAATKLPANPDGGHVDDYCSDLSPAFNVTPKSPGGRVALSLGWIVTSETKLGKYDAVTFVGALDAATSGTCVHRDGNLAIFEGSQLIGIGYVRPAKNLKPDEGPDGLGSAEQIDSRRIRLRWGLPGAPIADVVLRNGIYVEHTAKEDRVCGSAALVPNIFEQDIRRARKKLLAYGWLPRRSPEPLNGGMDEALRRQGVAEVEVCSGTGYGFCIFNYGNSKGLRLTVTSAGDEPHVIDYRVNCHPRHS